MKKLFKGLGIVLGVLVLLVAGLIGVATAKIRMDLAKRYDFKVPKLTKRGDLAHGKYLVTIRHACVECHGPDLSGGTVVEDPGAGYIYGANITPAGLKGWAEEDIVRVLRHGVSKDGRPLIVMPAAEFTNFSEQDTADVVAYVRSVPPVDKPSRKIRVGPAIKIMYLLGKVPQALNVNMVDHAKGFTPRVAEAPTKEFGKYLYECECTGCHHADRKGGRIAGTPPDWPPAANLTQDGIGTWTLEDFQKTLKTGVNPGGHTLKFPMIAKYSQFYKDVEVKAIWAFLQTPVAGAKPDKDAF